MFITAIKLNCQDTDFHDNTFVTETYELQYFPSKIYSEISVFWLGLFGGGTRDHIPLSFLNRYSVQGVESETGPFPIFFVPL